MSSDDADIATDPRVRRTWVKVLTAAHRLMVEEGLRSVTFGRISRETGVSRTTLYRHWQRPVDLLSDAWAAAVPPIEAPLTGDLRADLLELFSATRDSLQSGPMRRSLPSLIEAAESDDDIAALHAAFVAERRAPIVARLAAAAANGELAAGADPALLTDMLAGPLFYRRLMRHQETDDLTLAHLVDAVLHAAGHSDNEASELDQYDRS